MTNVYVYGASHQTEHFPMSVFEPQIRGNRATLANVEDPPVVKNQGNHPTCSAVAVIGLYESWLRRSGGDAPELSWAWTYLNALKMLDSHGSVPVKEQLLSGIPLHLCISALLEFGTISADTFGEGNDPVALRRETESRAMTPAGRLWVPMRSFMVLPTRDALLDAVWSQHPVAFTFGIDRTIDSWMHSEDQQRLTNYVCPRFSETSIRLATHAAIITGIDLERDTARIQNSFGISFGEDGYFYMDLPSLLEHASTGLSFYVLTRAG